MSDCACYRFLRRIIDLVVSLAAIILLLPVYLLIYLLIRIDSPGGGLFFQQRAGKDGIAFTLYKFRTMRVDVDPFGASPSDKADSRVTRVGRILRETSLDELPQLFNVLIGQMSLVGPRPLYISQIPEWNDYQKRRLQIKPGITGLAQVSGRGALTIEQKLDLDVFYVENSSLWLDLKIIFLTIWQVINRKSIYELRYSKHKKTRGGL